MGVIELDMDARGERGGGGGTPIPRLQLLPGGEVAVFWGRRREERRGRSDGRDVKKARETRKEEGGMKGKRREETGGGVEVAAFEER